MSTTPSLSVFFVSFKFRLNLHRVHGSPSRFVAFASRLYPLSLLCPPSHSYMPSAIQVSAPAAYSRWMSAHGPLAPLLVVPRSPLVSCRLIAIYYLNVLPATEGVSDHDVRQAVEIRTW
ncbi:hypothetical protein C8Q70DRAFT_68125 [Cubamyces menziesii]|nr:hypothetical protein C8Q70DRAFT_68125 [Cubamyces menziesii]